MAQAIETAAMHDAIHSSEEGCLMILRGLNRLVEHGDTAGVKIDLKDLDKIAELTTAIHDQLLEVHKRFESEPH